MSGKPVEPAIVAQKGPYEKVLEPGDSYWWCSCGHSAAQPFCDGSHSGTGHLPVKTTVTDKNPVYLCGCKATKTPPFCDGSHSSLP